MFTFGAFVSLVLFLCCLSDSVVHIGRGAKFRDEVAPVLITAFAFAAFVACRQLLT